MWEYNYIQDNNELYHHGILGMKWGVRRFQNKDGSLTLEGKKRAEREAKYNPKYDEYYTKIYGKKGAGRIKKRMIDKGYSRKKAVRTELGRQLVTNSLILGGLAFSAYQVASGNVSRLASKGKRAVSSFIDSKTEAYILDKSGNVIKKYWKSPVKDLGSSITSVAIRR